MPVIAQSQDDVLDLASAPSHAFPTPFPPNCLYDPFPEQNAFTSWRSLPWFRRSCTTFVAAQSHVDIDELIDRFSQLSVRGHSHGSPATSRRYSTSTSIAIIPSVAPHPALIRQGAHYKRPPVISFPCVSASPSARRLVFSSSPQSWSFIATPSRTGERTVDPVRKIAPLPRRSLRTPYGNEIPRITSNSPTPPPSSGSRSVSCSSDQCLQTHLDVRSRSSSPQMPVLSWVPHNLTHGAPFNHLPPASSCLLSSSNWISIPTDRIANLVSPPRLIPQCS